jgi:HEAT repeat protein
VTLVRPRRRLLLLLVVTAVALPAAAEAQPARLVNARIDSRPATGGLEKTVHALAAAQESPAWVAWSVPTPGVHHMCCYGSLGDLESGPCAGRCFLESEGRNLTVVNSDSGDCADRSGSNRMLVLLRLEARAPERLRTFSSDCTLDAGGLPVFWLSEVRPSESVALLEMFVGDPSLEHKKHWKGGEPALSAIALHDDPSADAAMEKFASPRNPESLRKQAFFWLGNARDRRGYEVLAALARTEESETMRRHLTFALSQSKVPDATGALMEMAKSDTSASVRGQALFWLAQKAGKKAVAAIGNAIRNDPETEVKTKAVFALTRMPKDEGIPLLIEVARTSRNPEVRRKAVFWLGQSRDPRALAFIEDVLK